MISAQQLKKVLSTGLFVGTQLIKLMRGLAMQSYTAKSLGSDKAAFVWNTFLHLKRSEVPARNCLFMLLGLGFRFRVDFCSEQNWRLEAAHQGSTQASQLHVDLSKKAT